MERQYGIEFKFGLCDNDFMGKVQKIHGGNRARAGRPKKYQEPTKRVRIPESLDALFRQWLAKEIENVMQRMRASAGENEEVVSGPSRRKKTQTSRGSK